MKKYCSECRKPLANPETPFCDKCGKPTTPKGFFTRFESGNMLSDTERKVLNVIGVLSCISAVLLFIEMLSLAIASGKGLKQIALLWDAGLVRTEDQIAAYLSDRIRNTLLMIVGIVFVLIAAAMLFYSVMFLLKRPWAFKIARGLYIASLVVELVSLNISSAALTFIILYKMKGLGDKMEGGSDYTYYKEQQEQQVAEIAADRTKWLCKSCGYVNTTADAQCKSCGKYKS